MELSLSDNLNIEKIKETLIWIDHIGAEMTFAEEAESNLVSLDDLLAKNKQIADIVADTQQNFTAPSIAGVPGRAIASQSTNQIPLGTVSAIAKAEKAAKACETLDDLKNALMKFDGCDLKKTAQNFIFADGNPASGIMIFGEAPGAEEDREGKAFVGGAGQLLDKMLSAIGLNSRNDFYLSQISPWRPPGNREPAQAEIDILIPFVRRHIELVAPKMVIALGGVAAKNLLDQKASIMRLRGSMIDKDGVTYGALFHPTYLLKQPAQKRIAWHDLLAIKTKLQELGVIKAEG